MSYTVVYTWKCDICGITAQNNHHSPPNGWQDGWVNYFGNDSTRPNCCSDCNKEIEAAKQEVIAKLQQKSFR